MPVLNFRVSPQQAAAEIAAQLGPPKGSRWQRACKELDTESQTAHLYALKCTDAVQYRQMQERVQHIEETRSALVDLYNDFCDREYAADAARPASTNQAQLSAPEPDRAKRIASDYIQLRGQVQKLFVSFFKHRGGYRKSVQSGDHAVACADAIADAIAMAVTMRLDQHEQAIASHVKHIQAHKKQIDAHTKALNTSFELHEKVARGCGKFNTRIKALEGTQKTE